MLSTGEKFRVRYIFDVDFNLKERVRRQLKKKARKDGVSELMRQALRRDGNSPKVEILLGYSIADLRRHLESLFIDDMSWDKYKDGLIHIDHVKPQSLFDLSDDKQWRECWGLSNLQPLWAEDNLRKSNLYKEA